MKKVVIHAGPHKTGSTYIQKMLHEHRRSLYDQGVAYPEVYYLYFGHHYFLNEIRQCGDNTHSIREVFESASQGADVCILSSENFRSFSNTDLEKVRQVFDGLEVEFVLYLRLPSLRLLSLWHETVKHGDFMSASDYFMQHLLKPMKSGELNIFLYVDALIKTFGRKAIKLIDYDSSFHVNGLMQDFFKAISLECLVNDKPIRVNEMMRLSEVEIIRYLNFRAKEDSLLNKSNVREAYVGIRNDISEQIDQLNEIMSPYMLKMQLGNTNADNMMFCLLRDCYSDLLINQMSSPSAKQVMVPDNSWGFDSKITERLEDIYLKYIKGACIKISSME